MFQLETVLGSVSAPFVRDLFVGCGMNDGEIRDGPKVVQLPPRNELAAAGDNLKRNLDQMIENVKTLAQYRRAAYLAYVESGFTEPQALELCCK